MKQTSTHEFLCVVARRAVLAGNANANRYGYTWSNAGIPTIVVSEIIERE
jgi:hypothetical protein